MRPVESAPCGICGSPRVGRPGMAAQVRGSSAPSTSDLLVGGLLPAGWWCPVVPPVDVLLKIDCDPQDLLVRIRSDGWVEASHLSHGSVLAGQHNLKVSAPPCCRSSWLRGELRFGVLVAEGMVSRFEIGVAGIVTAVMSSDMHHWRMALSIISYDAQNRIAEAWNGSIGQQ